MSSKILSLALNEIKSAVAVIGNNHQTQSRDLFDIELDPDVCFNGYRYPIEYKDYLFVKYENVKVHYEGHYPLQNAELQTCLRY